MAEVIAVNRYAVRYADAFRAAVTALADRVQHQGVPGVPGVRGYRFFCPRPDEGRAVATYADPKAWIAHHDLIMTWPGMADQRASADLAEGMLFGPMTAGMQDWIDRMDLGSKVHPMGSPVTGFLR
jgi:hypothetical protein